MDILRRVTLQGTAKDAKAGAVLVVADDRPIYLDGLDSWPKEALGKKVQASGILVTRKYIPDPVNENGEISQGAEGEQWVLAKVQWKILDE